MSKPQWKRVEKGIYRTISKDCRVRYQVRVAPETNSRKEVKRTVDSLADAQMLVREAARIRKEGKNVRDVWDAEVDRQGKRRVRVGMGTRRDRHHLHRLSPSRDVSRSPDP
jgi:arginyl-tRNA--protein-N-Asp/Glu arginylyltransferase